MKIRQLLESNKFQNIRKYIFKLQDVLEDEYESLDITTSAKIYENCSLTQSNNSVITFSGASLHIVGALIDFYIDLVLYDEHSNIISHYGRTNRYPFEQLLGIDFNVDYPDFGPTDIIYELNHQPFKGDNLNNNFLWFNKLNRHHDIIFKQKSNPVDTLYDFKLNHKKTISCSFVKEDKEYFFELNNKKFKTIEEFNKIRDDL